MPTTAHLPRQAAPVDERPDWPDLPDLPGLRRRLLALARRCGCTADDAQDVVQEALLCAGQHPPRNAGALAAYLDNTVRNLAVDQHRQQLRRIRLTERAARQPTDTPSHEDRVCDRAEAAWVSSHASALHSRQRQVLLARAAGHTTARIARDLGTTPKAVELLLRRSRLALQTLLAARAP